MATHKLNAVSGGFAFGAPSPKRGWVHSNGPILIHAFRFADACCIVLALRATLHVMERPWNEEQALFASVAVACFTLVASSKKLYRSWRFASISSELLSVMFCCVVGIGCVGLPVAIIGLDNAMPPLTLAIWADFSFIAVAAGRVAIRLGLRNWRASGRNFRTAVIVGSNDVARQLADSLQANPWMGIRLIGIARTIEELETIRAQRALDAVYIALPPRMHSRIRRIVQGLHDSTTSVFYVPDFSAYGPLRSSWGELGDMLTVGLVDTPHQGLDGALKRIVDVVLASMALLALALPMLGIAAAVKLTSHGPVIFAQKRYGLDGKAFRMYKFRSMRQVEDGESQFTFTQARRGDARITPLGAVLRKTSLDEIPQIFNVLKGDMSLVGPRPHPVALNECQRKLIDGYMLRHKVKPGITGLAQVNGFRGETDTPEKMQQRVRFDLEYINTWSLRLDARIMWRTLFVIFHDPNAY